MQLPADRVKFRGKYNVEYMVHGSWKMQLPSALDFFENDKSHLSPVFCFYLKTFNVAED